MSRPEIGILLVDNPGFCLLSLINFTQRAQRNKRKVRKACLVRKYPGFFQKKYFKFCVDNQLVVCKHRDKISRKYPTSVPQCRLFCRMRYFCFC